MLNHHPGFHTQNQWLLGVACALAFVATACTTAQYVPSIFTSAPLVTLTQPSPITILTQKPALTLTPTYGPMTRPSPTADPWGDVVIPAGGSVRIAALGPATGAMETLFARMRASMNLAAREHGQVHNLDITFVMFDTRANQSYALDAAQAVAADPSIVAVIGPVTSVEGIAVLPVLEEAHVLSISPSATRYNLTTFGPMTFNRVVLNQYQPGSQLGLEVDGLPEVQAFYTAHPELIEGLAADMRVFAPLTYDATMLLLTKINEVAGISWDGSLIVGRRSLADAIRSTTDYPGVTGSITIDEMGNRLP